MTDFSAILSDVQSHAAECAPRECCGLAVVVKGRLRYWPCRNLAPSAEQFALDPADHAAAEDAGEVVGVCHSHVYLPPDPSDADRAMCEQSGLPWLIVNHPTGAYRVIKPEGWSPPLIGREFTHGVLDCYTLIRDYYRQTLGIELPDFLRNDDWWLDGKNLYLEGYQSAGFVHIGGPEVMLREHDGLLLQVASPVPNHGAIYVGDNQILQHCHGRLSSRDVYGGYWRKVTTHVLRHRSLM